MRHYEDRPRHRLLKVLTAFGCLLAAVWGAAFYLSPQSSLRPVDAVVVVSGGQTQSRAAKGIELYKNGLAPEIIFSGAALDNGPSNARAMKEQALAAGVPAQAIVTDEQAETTYENALNTKQLLGHKRHIILVTSPYHQRRTYLTFNKVLGGNYEILNASSFDNRWSKATWWASPFGLYITASELGKVAYIYSTGHYQ